MRKDQCYFCKSRSCYMRIVNSKDGGKAYDEVACRRHEKDLETDSDKRAPGVMKYFIGGTGNLKRGAPVPVPDDW